MSTATTSKVPPMATTPEQELDGSTYQEHYIGELSVTAWSSPHGARVTAHVDPSTFGGEAHARQINKGNPDAFVSVTVATGTRSGDTPTTVKTFLSLEQAWDLLEDLSRALRPEQV